MVDKKEVGRQRSRKHADARKKWKSCEYYLVGNSEKNGYVSLSFVGRSQSATVWFMQHWKEMENQVSTPNMMDESVDQHQTKLKMTE